MFSQLSYPALSGKCWKSNCLNSFGPIFPESCAEVASERKKGQNVHVMNLFLGDAMQCECNESFFGDAHSGIIHYLYCKQLSCGLLKVQSNCTLRYVL